MPTPHIAHGGCPLADNGLGWPSGPNAAAAAAASISSLYSGVCNAGQTGITISLGSGISCTGDAAVFGGWLLVVAACVLGVGKLGRCEASGANVFCCKCVPIRSSSSWCLWWPIAWLWVQ